VFWVGITEEPHELTLIYAFWIKTAVHDLIFSKFNTNSYLVYNCNAKNTNVKKFTEDVVSEKTQQVGYIVNGYPDLDP
jgi:hypothetical protein